MKRLSLFLPLLPLLLLSCSGTAGGSGKVVDRRVITASAINGKGAVVTSDGHVWQFGGGQGDLSHVAALKNVVSVEAGDGYYALRTDGTVVGWNHDNPEGALPIEGVKDVIAMSAARTGEALFLRSDGTVIKAMRLNTAPDYKAPPISAGYVCGLGRCYEIVDGVSDAIGITAVNGGYYIIRSDHTVWGMKSDDPSYQRNPHDPHAPLFELDVEGNAASFRSGWILRTDGTIESPMRGIRNDIPVLFTEDLTNVVALDDGVALTADGSLYSLINEWVDDRRKPFKIMDNVVQFDFEETTLVALLADGTVKVSPLLGGGFVIREARTAFGEGVKVAMP